MKVKSLLAALAGSVSALVSAPLLAADSVPSQSLVLSGLRSQYQITTTATGFTITDVVGQTGTHQVTGATRVQFADTNLALDVNGHAGQAYRLYQAAFNRVPDLEGLGFWIDVLDRNVPIQSVADGFIKSPEFASLYGSNPSPEAFVSKVYTNVLHRAPDAGGYAYWVDVIKKGEPLRNVLSNISESPENQSQVASSIARGIEFTPMPVATAAAGLWEGSTGNGRKLAGVVLENGTFWMLYSKPNEPNSVVGVLAGNGSVSGNQFSSGSGYDFNLEGRGNIQTTTFNATVSSAVAGGASLNGTIGTLGADTNVSFNTTLNTEFTQAPPLSSVAGTFIGASFQRNYTDLQTLRIAPDGSISANAFSGCKVSGGISTKNRVSAFNFSLTFGAAPCRTPNTTVTGIGYYDATTRQFYSIAINGTRDDGFVFAGVKL
jgi:hypothetical protein